MLFSLKQPHNKIILLGLTILLIGCQAKPMHPQTYMTPAGSNTMIPAAPVIAISETPTNKPHTATATSMPLTVWVDPQLPELFLDNLILPAAWVKTETRHKANFTVNIIEDKEQDSSWIYALVAPFFTITDEVSLDMLKTCWQQYDSSSLPFNRLLVTLNTSHIIQSLWGEPSNRCVKIVDSLDLDSILDETNAWAIIPFENLEPNWKVIEIDGQSPIHKNFNQELYPLTISITISATDDSETSFLQNLMMAGEIKILKSNRDPGSLTTVILTGVTALVRATALTMEKQGITYPGEDIRDWLREADFTHISNEVAFSEDCPYPVYVQDDLVFCSRPYYIDLLEDIGTDIVELSGDHLSDWSDEAVLYSIDLYEQRDWMIYGGGKNLIEAQKPIYLEHNGNKIAFIGCNAKKLDYARVSETRPGALHCDMAWLEDQIKQIRSLGYLPIVTFQHEEAYTYSIPPALRPDFEMAANAGAVIVSGSQAHQPHAISFQNSAFIHYGLGNLFFDQYSNGLPMRQAFIDRHVFYNNHYISTELLTILFIDYARPRRMMIEERTDFLKIIFDLSEY